MVFYPVRRPPYFYRPPQREDCAEVRADEAEIRIADVVVSMTSRCSLKIPYEFSAIIPRVEIKRHYRDGQLSEEEMVLSSITIVHSPRRRGVAGGVVGGDKKKVVPPATVFIETVSEAVGDKPRTDWRKSGDREKVAPPRADNPPRINFRGRGEPPGNGGHESTSNNKSAGE